MDPYLLIPVWQTRYHDTQLPCSWVDDISDHNHFAGDTLDKSDMKWNATPHCNHTHHLCMDMGAFQIGVPQIIQVIRPFEII